MLSIRPIYRLLTSCAALALLLAACAPAPVAPQPTEVPPTQVPPAATPTTDPNEPVTSPGAGTPEPDPVLPAWAPQPGDADLDRGPIYIDLTEVLLLESFPVQVQLRLEGNRPTPCHQLRVAVAPPDAQNQILVDVYTVSEPGQICTEQLEPFAESINLGSYPSGDYTVLVNGALVAEITV